MDAAYQTLELWQSQIEPTVNQSADQMFKSKNWDAMFPLHYAAMKGDIEAIKNMCNPSNADQPLTPFFGSPATQWALSFGHLICYGELVKCGASVLEDFKPIIGFATKDVTIA